MVRKTFSVVFFCKKTKVTKKGKAPIYVRITTRGQSTEIYTQCKIEPENWNQKAERTLPRDKVAMQINEIIATYRANIFRAYDQLIIDGKNLTALRSNNGFATHAQVQRCSWPNLPYTAINGRTRSL